MVYSVSQLFAVMSPGTDSPPHTHAFPFQVQLGGVGSQEDAFAVNRIVIDALNAPQCED